MMGAVLPDPYDMVFDTKYEFGVKEYDEKTPIEDYQDYSFDKDIIEDPKQIDKFMDLWLEIFNPNEDEDFSAQVFYEFCDFKLC